MPEKAPDAPFLEGPDRLVRGRARRPLVLRATPDGDLRIIGPVRIRGHQCLRVHPGGPVWLGQRLAWVRTDLRQLELRAVREQDTLIDRVPTSYLPPPAASGRPVELLNRHATVSLGQDRDPPRASGRIISHDDSAVSISRFVPYVRVDDAIWPVGLAPGPELLERRHVGPGLIVDQLPARAPQQAAHRGAHQPRIVLGIRFRRGRARERDAEQGTS